VDDGHLSRLPTPPRCHQCGFAVTCGRYGSGS
jgi:hypothetical protein